MAWWDDVGDPRRGRAVLASAGIVGVAVGALLANGPWWVVILVTALQPVDRARLLRQRGRLVPSEVDRLAAQLRTYLGL